MKNFILVFVLFSMESFAHGNQSSAKVEDKCVVLTEAAAATFRNSRGLGAPPGIYKVTGLDLGNIDGDPLTAILFFDSKKGKYADNPSGIPSDIIRRLKITKCPTPVKGPRENLAGHLSKRLFENLGRLDLLLGQPFPSACPQGYSGQTFDSMKWQRPNLPPVVQLLSCRSSENFFKLLVLEDLGTGLVARVTATLKEKADCHQLNKAHGDGKPANTRSVLDLKGEAREGVVGFTCPLNAPQYYFEPGHWSVTLNADFGKLMGTIFDIGRKLWDTAANQGQDKSYKGPKTAEEFIVSATADYEQTDKKVDLSTLPELTKRLYGAQKKRLIDKKSVEQAIETWRLRTSGS